MLTFWNLIRSSEFSFRISQTWPQGIFKAYSFLLLRINITQSTMKETAGDAGLGVQLLAMKLTWVGRKWRFWLLHDSLGSPGREGSNEVQGVNLWRDSEFILSVLNRCPWGQECCHMNPRWAPPHCLTNHLHDAHSFIWVWISASGHMFVFNIGWRIVALQYCC